MTATQERPPDQSSPPASPAGGKPSRFKYVAQTLDGQTVKGEIESSSINAARNELAVKGIRVTKITERKGLNVEITKAKVPLVEIMHFCRQMATFVKSGVPITEAMQITVSSEIEKRMDDSTSTAARSEREPTERSSPWVEVVMSAAGPPQGANAPSGGRTPHGVGGRGGSGS